MVKDGLFVMGDGPLMMLFVPVIVKTVLPDVSTTP
jgi:hypothetical protein